MWSQDIMVSGIVERFYLEFKVGHPIVPGGTVGRVADRRQAGRMGLGYYLISEVDASWLQN
jgi:hypothetical protein